LVHDDTLYAGTETRLRRGPVGRIDFCIGDEAMQAYRELSGDDNPLHLDAGFARRCGFDGPVVYGGLIVAQISRLLGSRLPGPGCVCRALTLRFRNPLYVDEPARLHVVLAHSNVDLGVFELGLSVEASGRGIADGEASALLMLERESQYG
jgi:3-hydroxybutyryl-CoA dehydratase